LQILREMVKVIFWHKAVMGRCGYSNPMEPVFIRLHSRFEPRKPQRGALQINLFRLIPMVMESMNCYKLEVWGQLEAFRKPGLRDPAQPGPLTELKTIQQR